MIKKILVLIFVSATIIQANSIKPTSKIFVSGGITDMIISSNKLLVATTQGKIDVIDINTKKITKTITLDKIKDFVGELIYPKAYSVDSINNKILVVAQVPKGYSEIYEFVDNKLTKIISKDSKMFILRAKYINQDTILFATIGNEMISYDTKTKLKKWKNHISYSKFSYFMISENKQTVAISDESGDIKLHNIKDGRLLKKYTQNNLDNVFQIDFKNSLIITAGQDRKTFIIDTTMSDSFMKKANFLVYSCALNADATIGAYSKYQNNDVSVFDIETKNEITKLTGNKMNISKILFLNNKEIFVASDAKQLNYYKLPN